MDKKQGLRLSRAKGPRACHSMRTRSWVKNLDQGSDTSSYCIRPFRGITILRPSRRQRVVGAAAIVNHYPVVRRHGKTQTKSDNPHHTS